MSATLTTGQLAQRWNMQPKTIYNWRIAKKGPPFIKVGGGRNGKVLYRLDDIVKWENDRTRGAA
jgi:hypothetical protein